MGGRSNKEPDHGNPWALECVQFANRNSSMPNLYEAPSKYIIIVQYVFEGLSFFWGGGHIVLQGFAVFGTILHVHKS